MVTGGDTWPHNKALYSLVGRKGIRISNLTQCLLELNDKPEGVCIWRECNLLLYFKVYLTFLEPSLAKKLKK